MDTCGMSFIKYILFLFNLIFAISGLGIIIAGGLVLSDVSDFRHFTSSELLGPPVVLIVAGSVVFIIAFLGCFGAIRESYNMLLAYAGLLLIIFVLELAAGIAAAVYKNDFQDAFKQTLKSSMVNYTKNDVEKLAWDNVQQKLKCCGVESYKDWETVPPASNEPYPGSCCIADVNAVYVPADQQQPSEFCENVKKIGTTSLTEGCYHKIKTKIEANVRVLMGVGIGIAFVELIGIVLACWLAYTIKKENETTNK